MRANNNSETRVDSPVLHFILEVFIFILDSFIDWSMCIICYSQCYDSTKQIPHCFFLFLGLELQEAIHLRTWSIYAAEFVK